jgi:hypothetical protein
MVTIRQAHIFLLAGSKLESDPTFHQRWLDALTAICSQLDTHYSYTNTVVA